MSMKGVNLSFKHYQDVSLYLGGIRLINYYDIKNATDNDETEILFPYSDLKCNLLSSFVLSDGEHSIEESILKNTFIMDKSDTSNDILNEAKKLQEFANDLVKSIEDAQERN